MLIMKKNYALVKTLTKQFNQDKTNCYFLQKLTNVNVATRYWVQYRLDLLEMLNQTDKSSPVM